MNSQINFSKSGSGASIILLHGWGGSLNSLKKLENILAEKFTVYNLDLPGFGNSPINKNLKNAEDFAEEIIKFINSQNLNNPLIFGHSFGGSVAFVASSKYKFKKVILASPSLVRDRSSKFGASKKIAGIVKKFSKFPLYENFRRLIYKRILKQEDYINSKELKSLYLNVISEDLLKYSDKIQNETILIWPENDKYTPINQSVQILDNMKNSKFFRIPNMGHNLPLVKPEIVANIIFENFESGN